MSDNTALWPTAFARNSLIGTEARYNTEVEALGILHGLEKFHHYCFASELSLITEHKPYMAIFKKDVGTLSQRLQQIPLCLYQYRIQFLYKPSQQLYIAAWLSRHSHIEDKDEEITGMNLTISKVETCNSIPECMMAEEIRHTVHEDDHLNTLTLYMIMANHHLELRSEKRYKCIGYFMMTWQSLMI